MDVETARLACSPAATRLLADIGPQDVRDPLALSTRLRRDHDAALVAAVVTQATLRERARAKWPDPESMRFTPDGVEQATRAELAARHADRLAAAERVLDLGCGIGSDARAFLAVGLDVHALDADEATALVAGFNLGRTVQVGLAQDATVEPDDAVWLDPARRTPGVADISGRTRRVFRLEDLSPTWRQVQHLAGAARAAGAKLSPSFPHAVLPPGCEVEWTSFDGEVLEAVVWWGQAVRSPGRSATVVGRDGTVSTVVDGPVTLAEPPQDGSYLYEPDRAVIRARLTHQLESRVVGRELDPGVGYVTSEGRIDLPWARRYRVVERMPLHAKTFRAWARARGIGRVTIKRRGATPDPEAFRRELRLSGSSEATIVLTTDHGARTLLVVERDT